MDLIASPAPLTMSSREIADLTGKEHAHVLRDIRSMLSDLGERESSFGGTYQVPGPNGATRSAPCFNLPKDLTITLVAGYSVQLRHRIVKRWQELEARQAPSLPDFSNPAIAARAWADQFEARQQAEQALALAAPKVETLERITGNSRSRSLRDASRVLKVPEKKFIATLLAHGWLLRGPEYLDGAGNVCAGKLTAAAEARTRGYLEVNVVEAGGKARDAVRVTPSGVERLGTLLPKWAAQEGSAA